MLCSRCKTNEVKFANTTLCEDCETDPAVCPAVNDIAMPSFMVARYARKENANLARNPEQAARYNEIHDTPETDE